ncbi:hypothetical protein ACHAXH_001147, partial [Discostella pseudostelligera]
TDHGPWRPPAAAHPHLDLKECVISSRLRAFQNFGLTLVTKNVLTPAAAAFEPCGSDATVTVGTCSPAATHTSVDDYFLDELDHLDVSILILH